MPKTLTLAEWDKAVERLFKFQDDKLQDAKSPAAGVWKKIAAERMILIQAIEGHLQPGLAAVVRHRAAGLLP